MTIILPLLLGVAVPLYSQFTEDFSDGNYTENPEWVGDYPSFAINAYGQLQSKAQEAGYHYLSTSCTVNRDGYWEFWCRITKAVSAQNNIRFHLLSTEENPLEGAGWFVQVGGSLKNITLRQQREDKDPLIRIQNDARKGILDKDDNRVWIQVRLDESGIFHLYSQVEGTDSIFQEEGQYKPTQIGESEWFSIVVRNSKNNGSAFYADNILVTGRTEQKIEEERNKGESQGQGEKRVWAEQREFTPNSDGFNDTFTIYYSLPCEGFSVQVRVFTPTGNPIYTFPIENGLQTEGTLSWNGHNDTGNIVSTGIYVILCEFFHPTTGETVRAKIPVAVTAR